MFGVALMAGGALVWTGVIVGIAIWRHYQFLSHRFDLGNMVQAVWSTTQGRPLEMTDAASGEQIVRLAAHVDPILVLFAPLFFVLPGPETLIVAQSLALVSGVYPVLRLALKHTSSQLAAGLLGVWYLLFPWVVWNALNDFHPVTLSIPLLLYCIWFLDEGRMGLFVVAALSAASTGELVTLTIAGLGLWYGLAHGKRRTGFAIAAGGVAWTTFCLAVVIPAFADGQSSRYYDRFESVGGSPTGVIRTLVAEPQTIVTELTSPNDLAYLLSMLAPTALLALGAPLLLLAAIPQLAVNLLSEFWSTTQPMFHYGAAVMPVLVAGTIFTIARLPERGRPLAAVTALAMAVGVLTIKPPLPGGQEFVFGHREPAPRRAAIEEALGFIPPSVPVVATNRLGAHLSERRVVHLFPDDAGAEWAILDVRDAWLHVAGERVNESLFAQLLDSFERDVAWHTVFDREDVRVYRKVP